MRISDWSSDVCSSDLIETGLSYDIRLVEEAAPEDEVETFAVPFDFVIQDAFLVVGQSLQRKSIEERSEEHTSELQSLMRISYAVFCLKKKLVKNRQLLHILLQILAVVT